MSVNVRRREREHSDYINRAGHAVSPCDTSYTRDMMQDVRKEETHFRQTSGITRGRETGMTTEEKKKTRRCDERRCQVRLR